MKTLLLTAYTPKLDSGRGVRTYGVIAALARSGAIEVAYLPFDGPQPAAAYDALPNVSLTRLGGSRGLDRAYAYVKARLRGVPDELARGVYAELEATVRTAPDDVRIVADGTVPAAALLGLARRHPFVYCAHNLESAFRHTLADTHSTRSTYERFERRILAAATESWMVSRADVEGALRLCPGARIRLVPNVVDVTAIAPVTSRRGSRRVLFVADLTYTPNRVGLEFLRTQVLAPLRAAVPDAEIVIVGRGGRPEDEVAGIRMLGRVEDLAPIYRETAVVAVPLLQGGGSPLKFVEALAYGLPIVATPKAAAGLEVESGVHYVEAADGARFAAALAHILLDGGAEMGARGRALVVERYSVDALANELRN